MARAANHRRLSRCRTWWAAVGIFALAVTVITGSAGVSPGLAQMLAFPPRPKPPVRPERSQEQMVVRADEINYLSGPGKGVILIKLTGDEDHVLGFIASSGDRDLLRVETSRGGEQTISTAKYEVTGRGGKGRELLQRGQFTRIIPNDIENPEPLTSDA